MMSSFVRPRIPSPCLPPHLLRKGRTARPDSPGKFPDPVQMMVSLCSRLRRNIPHGMRTLPSPRPRPRESRRGGRSRLQRRSHPCFDSRPVLHNPAGRRFCCIPVAVALGGRRRGRAGAMLRNLFRASSELGGFTPPTRRNIMWRYSYACDGVQDCSTFAQQSS